MCLYHRDRMPLNVIDGALARHPTVGAPLCDYRPNPFYDAAVTTIAAAAPAAVLSRLAQLGR